jgi:hypothetical protein
MENSYVLQSLHQNLLCTQYDCKFNKKTISSIWYDFWHKLRKVQTFFILTSNAGNFKNMHLVRFLKGQFVATIRNAKCWVATNLYMNGLCDWLMIPIKNNEL